MTKAEKGFFAEYPCRCGDRDCKKMLHVTRTPGRNTVALALREQGHCTLQVYLDAEQVAILADELRMLAGA